VAIGPSADVHFLKLIRLLPITWH